MIVNTLGTKLKNYFHSSCTNTEKIFINNLVLFFTTYLAFEIKVSNFVFVHVRRVCFGIQKLSKSSLFGKCIYNLRYLKVQDMKKFMDEDFLLQTDTARQLYHEHT